MCTNHGCGCHVYLCVLASVAMCIPVGLCVAVSASVTGCSRLQYFLVLHPEWADYYSLLRLLQVLLRSMPSQVHDPTYPEILWSLLK